LFREAEICYAIVAVVTNWGAGLSPQPLSHSEVEAMMAQKLPLVAKIFERVIAGFDFPRLPVPALPLTPMATSQGRGCSQESAFDLAATKFEASGSLPPIEPISFFGSRKIAEEVSNACLMV
jgi:hypothetical protein